MTMNELYQKAKDTKAQSLLSKKKLEKASPFWLK